METCFSITKTRCYARESVTAGKFLPYWLLAKECAIRLTPAFFNVLISHMRIQKTWQKYFKKKLYFLKSQEIIRRQSKLPL